MKKTFTILSAAALCCAANAQSLKILDLGTGGIPGIDEPPLIGLGISADGKFVCGSMEMGAGCFVYNTETNENVWSLTDDDEGAELRHVSNQGLAIGYDGPGITYSIDGTKTELIAPEGYKYVLGEDLSNDGSIMVGSLISNGYATYGAVSKDRGEWTVLPMPADELLGDYADMGSMARWISGDGKIILGHVGNFGPAIIWTLNENGEYVPDPIYTRYLASDENPDGEFFSFTPCAISNNGKYVLVMASYIDESGTVPAVYNTETKELTEYYEVQEIDEYGLGLQPTAIADNGTFIGIIGNAMTSAGGFIMTPGESQAEFLWQAFPECAETLAILDMTYSHVPTCMSADGRYILGYGYYVDDLEAEEPNAFFATYVLDTEIADEVKGIESEASATDAVEFFGIDGQRRFELLKGINIVRMSDGSVRKIMK